MDTLELNKTHLKKFQDVNCKECRFEYKELSGTGQPCCTKATMAKVLNGTCLDRRHNFKK